MLICASRLLQAAVGLGRAKAPGVTDKLLQLVMSLYKAQPTLKAKTEFLSVICNDFGVNSMISYSNRPCIASALSSKYM